MSKQRVVVIGGGFGGLSVVQALSGADMQVTLIDKRNHHLFQPLLYQVATAGLSPSDIAEPLRSVLARQANVEVMLAEVTSVDVDECVVTTSEGPVPYDRLVVAAGMRTSYFGNDEWEAHAPGLKTLGDALELRRRVLGAFEQAEWCEDTQERARLLTFVVVGAGPTGVELAGAIQELAQRTLPRDFRHVDPTEARVLLVEAGTAVLPPFPADLQVSAHRALEEMGVEVRVGQRVERLDAVGVRIDGEDVAAATVLWAAGVRGAALGASLGVPLDRAGRVPVLANLSVEGHPEVFVIGDLAHFDHDLERPLPGVAQVALQMGKYVARTLRAGGESVRPFTYTDLGSMATIGRSRAVVDLGRIRFSGVIAWLAWVFVHLMTLVGHRNRVVVFVKWAWAWWTADRSSRLLWQDEPGGERRRRD